MCGCALIRHEDIVALKECAEQRSANGPRLAWLGQVPPPNETAQEGAPDPARSSEVKAATESVATEFRAREAFGIMLEAFNLFRTKTRDVDDEARLILALKSPSKKDLATALGLKTQEGTGTATTAEPSAADPQRDLELTQIKGVGPAFAHKLMAQGVDGIQDLANASDTRVAQLDRALDARGRVSAWRAQAQALIAGG